MNEYIYNLRQITVEAESREEADKIAAGVVADLIANEDITIDEMPLA
jgi:hypothetical protein